MVCHHRGDLGGKHGEGQPGTGDGDDDGPADEGATEARQHVLEHGDGSGLGCGDELLVGKHAVGNHGSADVEDEKDDEAEDGRGADLGLLLGAVAHDGSALDADEDPHHDEDALRHLVRDGAEARLVCRHDDGVALSGAPEVGGKDAGVEAHDGKEDEEEDGRALDDHDDRVEERGGFYAVDNQEGDCPEEHGDDHDAHDGGVAGLRVGEYAGQHAAEAVLGAEDLGDHRSEADVAEPCGQPVSPAADEAVERAEALLCVCADAVELRTLGADVCKRECEEQEAKAAHEPRNERGAGGSDIGELTCQGEDAGADAGGDDHANEAKEAYAVGIVDLSVVVCHIGTLP